MTFMGRSLSVCMETNQSHGYFRYPWLFDIDINNIKFDIKLLKFFLTMREARLPLSHQRQLSLQILALDPAVTVASVTFKRPFYISHLSVCFFFSIKQNVIIVRKIYLHHKVFYLFRIIKVNDVRIIFHNVTDNVAV